MKTILLIILALGHVAFGEGAISPIKDNRGFVGGTFTGNASGLTNYLGTNYFGEMRITTTPNHGTTDTSGTPSQLTNWNSSVSFGVGVNTSLGYLTNNIAGYWTISGEINVAAADVENYSFQIISNGVAVDGAARSFTLAGASYIATVPISYTTYLPAGTSISIGAWTDVAPAANTVTLGTFRIERK